MIPRTLTEKAKSLLTKFPIVSISGPRQSGKTTFSKLVSPDFEYVNVELPDQRLLAEKDPRAFLGLYSNKVILDEVQNVPTCSRISRYLPTSGIPTDNTF